MHLLSAAEPKRPAAPPDRAGAPSPPQRPGQDASPALETTGATARRVQVRVDAKGFVSWALLDRRTGRLTGSDNAAAPGAALSVVIPWLAADHLRRAEARGGRPTGPRLRDLRRIVRGGDGRATDALYNELGGAATIRRLVKTCGLTDSRPRQGHWAGTAISARDVARLGLCLADGRAAGPRWTPWLLDELRRVTGPGNFGIRRALPGPAASTVGIKNGWLLRGGSRWHVNCLAVAQDWVVSVMARYPARLGLAHGKALCRTVGGQLLLP